MKKKHYLAAFLCAVAPAAYAAEATMDEVVVTATRIEQPVKQSVGHVTVINAKEISESQAVDVPTLLRRLAGVEIYQAGGIGKQSSVFMRGTNSNHVLVLLDGVRIGSATTGATAIDQLMLDQIERIEVVRGNASSLYGSDAIGGVIQIFTKKGKGEPALHAQAGAGSYRSSRVSAGYGGKTESAAFNLQASRYFTAGYSALDPRVYPNANPDKDGYANTSLSGNWRQALGGGLTATLSGFDSRGEVNYDNPWAMTPTEVNVSKTHHSKTAFELEERFSPNWLAKFIRSRGLDNLDTLTNGVGVSHIQSTNELTGLENTFWMDANNTLLVSMEKQRQKVESNTVYGQTERSVDSVLVSYNTHTETQQLQFSKRRDTYSDFGQVWTQLLSYGVDLNPNWQLSYSAGTAFRAPTFNDMYAPAFWGSNPNLRPEQSNNTEWGLHYQTDTTRIDIASFDNRITDLIAADQFWVMQNIAQARIKGTELALQSQLGKTRWTLANTWQDPRNEQTGALLLRRARTYGNVGFQYQLERWQWGMDWQYAGVRDDFGGAKLPFYALFDLTWRYHLSTNTDVTLRADNLLNKTYTSAYGYNSPGRTFFLGLSYR